MKELTIKMKEGKLKEWTRKMKEWKIKFYILNEDDIAYIIFPQINYNDGRSNGHSMGCNNLIVGSLALHNVEKIYANVVNYIAIFLPTPQTNIITNETILTQYSIT